MASVLSGLVLIHSFIQFNYSEFLQFKTLKSYCCYMPIYQPVLMIYRRFWYIVGAEENPTGDTLAHLKLVKAEQAGFIAYLQGNRRYGVIG